MCPEDISDEFDNDENVNKKLSENDELGDTTSSAAIGSDPDSTSGTEEDIQLWADFEFDLPAMQGLEHVKIKLNEPLMDVTVLWSNKMLKKYDTYRLDTLPEVFKPQLFTKRTQESVSIYKCLEAFLKEEPLGPEDMWLVYI